ncbi:E3 ubiquitin-protein ligase RNF43 [Eublepharis macularius]|uniref:E3 ubiquitin-protein ligase RNF43 n=1 Tax=Eublepharis macularius TaxID=481883 RepID=A0AA97KMJ2_EUBMA|nr:E3 ubiquitin-protein ligase RNF43 [Eublepharis macularius]
MSVGPQLQLAVLWPWLLMATLQIRLGYSGLALAAAVEADRSLAQKAIIRVIPFKLEPLMLEGVFASVADVTPAEGKLLQFHPLSLCNTSEDEHTIPGFVSIVKLERPERDLHPCLSLANKAKLAGERGARAVLFDITDDQGAADQLKKPRGLSHPVVLIWGHDAELLMGVVNNNREAHVKIEVKEMPAWPDYDVWILLTVVSTVLFIVLIFIIRSRCQPSRIQNNVQEETLRAINQLATRRYQARCRQAPTGDSASTCSSAPVCAICLEEFSEGQELRIITCFHEFHRWCIDPWLQQHQTCPLCMFNIVDQDSSALPLRSREDVPQSRPGQRSHFLRQQPGHALYHFPQTLPPVPPRNCGHPFFHSPQLSQSGLGTMHYLCYGPAGSESWCSHQTPLAQGLLVSQPQESLLCEQAPPPHRPCLLQRQPPCRGLRTPHSEKLNRAVPPHRGIRYAKHHHHSSGSGESYLTEPSGYLPDGPGSDTSSGPCHGSSSDSMLNCTDVSLQAIHGSCSTFHSSLSSDYDPFAFCGSERSATENRQEPTPPWRDLQPQSVDTVVEGGARLGSNHVHYHHHHHRHHHYGRSPPDCLNGRPSREPIQRKAKYPRAKVEFLGAQAQRRTERVQLLESGSASQDVTRLGQPSCLPQGHTPSLPDGLGSNMAAGGQSGAVRSQTCQRPYLQLHPSRRKWKHPPVSSSQSPLPENSSTPPDCTAPTHCGHSSANCCPTERRPLMPSGSSTHCFSGCQQISKRLALPSSLKPQEQGNRTGEQDCEPVLLAEGSGADTTGSKASFYLSCQIPQHHQGSKEDIPEIYEHSV